ncbi:hypothetical protein HPB51_025210 [Rhipicephalus microplus]|uniref:Transposable element P transposase-like RNase H domain-containing protein n=1 Tax=Rhipicephalus microplus TaxID=6941 RepID=A0A9J6DRB7_RHIMP|nr:hypothetical protein HPB51_025210 [Rhipicephalus microplus]
MLVRSSWCGPQLRYASKASPRKSPTLLQDHFTEDQFEPIILKNTGEKKLRPFATPSIFLHPPVAKPRKPPSKRTRVESTDDPKVKQNTQVDVEPQPVDTENDKFLPSVSSYLSISWELGQPLPTERTLHCHLEDYKFTPGLLEDIMVPLALKVSLMSTEERHATLMLDEMQLAPGLVYNPSSGTVLGAPTIPLAD